MTAYSFLVNRPFSPRWDNWLLRLLNLDTIVGEFDSRRLTSLLLPLPPWRLGPVSFDVVTSPFAGGAVGAAADAGAGAAPGAAVGAALSSAAGALAGKAGAI